MSVLSKVNDVFFLRGYVSWYSILMVVFWRVNVPLFAESLVVRHFFVPECLLLSFEMAWRVIGMTCSGPVGVGGGSGLHPRKKNTKFSHTGNRQHNTTRPPVASGG